MRLFVICIVGRCLRFMLVCVCVFGLVVGGGFL